MSLYRRRFLEILGFSSAALFAGAPLGFGFLRKDVQTSAPALIQFGPLVKDPDGLMDLPEGFSYKVISRAGERMSDGFLVPGHADGMGAVADEKGDVILMRNHELSHLFPLSQGPFGEDLALLPRLPLNRIYDRGTKGIPPQAGVTTLVYDTRAQALKKQFLSLAGTLFNCGGNLTPWNTWLSCEELFEGPDDFFARSHGYVFEVPVSSRARLATPRPLKAMGRFLHEGAAVHPEFQAVYQTEDQKEGLFYRFLPKKPGKLARGGILQCLALTDKSRTDLRNWEGIVARTGEKLDVEWKTLEDVNRKKDDLRFIGIEQGGIPFANGEGVLHNGGKIIFACTNGGRRKQGQIWRYHPSPFEGSPREKEQPGQVELVFESPSLQILEHPDQMTMTPWGDLFVCEDGYGDQFLKGLRPNRTTYPFARNALDESEFAGVCFSPDKTTMFLNMQDAGITFAVTGPFPGLPGS